jgi:hypothetical protein
MESQIKQIVSEFGASSDPSSRDLFGYPIANFALMQKGTDIRLIIQAMVAIVKENWTINHKTTSFNGSASNCVGFPYMELLYPDFAGGDNDGQGYTYYVYSATNHDGYPFTTDASNLVIKGKGVSLNPFRFYMWNTTIFNLAVEPTDEFPSEKYIPFTNGARGYNQKFDLKATVIPNQNGAYTTSTVKRNTIYVYEPSTVLYCLVDTNNKLIYVMQTGNNQSTGTTPLTPENMIYNQTLIADSLPQGLLFLCAQLTNTQTVLIVSSPARDATLMQDSIGNSYQLADPHYAKVLYDSFLPSANHATR